MSARARVRVSTAALRATLSRRLPAAIQESTSGVFHTLHTAARFSGLGAARFGEPSDTRSWHSSSPRR